MCALLLPDLLTAKTETFSSLRYALQQSALQPGVYSDQDFKVSQRAASANNTVDIAAGGAWTLGQGAVRQGLYHAVNDATLNQGTFANGDATNPRIDQVLLVVDDSAVAGGADQARIVIAQGTASAGATLTNRTGAVSDATLTSTYRAWLRLADVLMPVSATTVTTANIQDRRLWARGAHAYAAGTTGSPTTSSSTAAVLPEMTVTFECSNAPITVEYSCVVSHSAAGGGIDFLVRVDGANTAFDSTRTVTSAAGSALQTVASSVTLLPGAGRHTFAIYWLTNSGATATAFGTRRFMRCLETIRDNSQN